MQGYNNDNDDYIQGAASAFGFAGAHVHVKLDFIDAAYAGAWSKPAAAPDDGAAASAASDDGAAASAAAQRLERTSATSVGSSSR